MSHATSHQHLGPAKVLVCYEMEPVSLSNDPDEKESFLPYVTGAYVNHELVPREFWEGFVGLLETWEASIEDELTRERVLQVEDAQIAAYEEQEA